MHNLEGLRAFLLFLVLYYLYACLHYVFIITLFLKLFLKLLP